MQRDCGTISVNCNVEHRRMRTWRAWVWLGSLLVLTGCGGGGNETADRSSAHELPAHYPEHLAAGVGRLRELWLQLQPSGEQAENSTGSDHLVASGSGDALAEFADLIEWLPGLAAASDLGEADWRICQQASTEVSLAVAPLLSLDKLTQQQRLKEIATMVEQGLQRLTPVVSEFERLEQRYRSAEDVTDGSDEAIDHADQEESPA